MLDYFCITQRCFKDPAKIYFMETKPSGRVNGQGPCVCLEEPYLYIGNLREEAFRALQAAGKLEG
jgi:hypothetical protein